MTDEAISDLANRVLARPAGGPIPARLPTTPRRNRRTPRRRRTVVTVAGGRRLVSWSPTGAGRPPRPSARSGVSGHPLVGPTLAEHVRPEAFDRTTGRLTLR